MSLKRPKTKKPSTPYKHEGYKTTLYYASHLVRCDDDAWANDANIQFGVHFMMSLYANRSAMMITTFSLQRLISKRKEQ